jgi:hypothetical protein
MELDIAHAYRWLADQVITLVLTHEELNLLCAAIREAQPVVAAPILDDLLDTVDDYL